ncbi:methyl-accepting chemotaxis protein, partial [Planobispora takensis]
MAVVALLVGLIGIGQMGSINDRADTLYKGGMVPLQQIDQVRLDLSIVRMDLLNHGLSRTEATMATYEQALKTDAAKVTQNLDAYASNSASPELVEDLRGKWENYQGTWETLLTASRNNDDLGVAKARDEVTGPAFKKAADVVEKIAAAETADGKKLADEAAAAYSSGRTTTIIVLVAGLLVALIGARLIAGKVVASIGKVSHVIEGLAAGDLTRKADVSGRDEIGTMAAGLDRAMVTLRGTVTGINANSEQLAGASQELAVVSEQIAGSAEQTSGRADAVSAAAEQVSRNVETVSAASEQMTASIKEIATSASDAAKIAHDAVQVAATANDTIAQLGESSAEIGNVIKTITSIA